MISLIETTLALRANRRAVTALEYGLVGALIAGATVTAASTYGQGVSDLFNQLAANISGHWHIGN